jgi:uncharacterized protein (DUF39 family)
MSASKIVFTFKTEQPNIDLLQLLVENVKQISGATSDIIYVRSGLDKIMSEGDNHFIKELVSWYTFLNVIVKPLYR